MAFIKTYEKKNSNILRLNYEREIIITNPDYQRNGDIWTLEKRQLLIDSILNDYDIPKIYFHSLDFTEKKRTGKEYAIIDGRQRLETIWQFYDNKFALSNEFEFYANPNIKAAGLTYSDLARIYPELKLIFDSCELPIICVETDDIDLIDDMFLRLNEAVPLNAAEKRNAIGGPMTKAIVELAEHSFFNCVKFSNKRYQYREVAVRLLFIVHSIEYHNKVIDTKKEYLDEFVKEFKKKPKTDTVAIQKTVNKVLSKMKSDFSNKDSLLASQSVIPIYFIVYWDIQKGDYENQINRAKILNFVNRVDANKKIAERDFKKSNYDLLEYSRLSIQGTNDASSIVERVKILKKFISKIKKII